MSPQAGGKVLCSRPQITQLPTSENRLTPSAYLLTSYATGFLLLLAIYLLRGKVRLPGWAFLYGTVAAVASYLGACCTLLPASVVFPVSLSVPILLGMFISPLSKEKITATGWTSVTFGVAGILILAICTTEPPIR